MNLLYASLQLMLTKMQRNTILISAYSDIIVWQMVLQTNSICCTVCVMVLC